MRTEPTGLLRSGGIPPARLSQPPRGPAEPALILFQLYRLVMASLMAILFFGGIWGLWGVFFAIPLATLVNAVIRAWPKSQVPAGAF